MALSLGGDTEDVNWERRLQESTSRTSSSTSRQRAERPDGRSRVRIEDDDEFSNILKGYDLPLVYDGIVYIHNVEDYKEVKRALLERRSDVSDRFFEDDRDRSPLRYWIENPPDRVNFLLMDHEDFPNDSRQDKLFALIEDMTEFFTSDHPAKSTPDFRQLLAVLKVLIPDMKDDLVRRRNTPGDPLSRIPQMNQDQMYTGLKAIFDANRPDMTNKEIGSTIKHLLAMKAAINKGDRSRSSIAGVNFIDAMRAAIAAMKRRGITPRREI